ncbi:CgeB family protein [Arthrobacter burdickii]|uniref:Glycosyltransferase n=1 Tax=Arthrobacter burdickii TaxID=3035920 RepID=A0ABT8K545_9MICC|nr:glycosyltransferase [Arthrobacter burdickii]MDN4612581.1 glycosyltransferase [Arthrobacter burdickii]
MRILYVGPIWLGSNALSMANGMLEAGHDLTVIDTSPINRLKKYSKNWAIQKVTRHRPISLVRQIDAMIEKEARSSKYDVLFCYKTIYLSQENLLALPIETKIHYSADDVSNPANISANYLRSESQWHRIVTTKRHNVREISARGGTPFLVMSAYDPAWHYRQVAPLGETYKFGFVGNRRPDRVDLVRRLSARFGPNMVVSGEGWTSDPKLNRSGAVVKAAAYGPQYSRMIASIGVNLVLLNSENRDTHTCRSFEVPASGGLFLGPRTSEHQELLDDGREALLYSSEDEFEYHIERLQRGGVDISKMALAGHRRITTSRNTYRDRATEILGLV